MNQRASLYGRLIPTLGGIFRRLPGSTKRIRVTVAGDVWMGYRLCTSFTEGKVIEEKEPPLGYRIDGFPRDEWKKRIRIGSGDKAVPIDLMVELHGPWVWSLYNVMPPSDYFRRSHGLVVIADASREDSMRDAARFVMSADAFRGDLMPAVFVVDESHYPRPPADSPLEIAVGRRNVGVLVVNLQTGQRVRDPFTSITAMVLASGAGDAPSATSKAGSKRPSSGRTRTTGKRRSTGS